jgi:hypothetical protein
MPSWGVHFANAVRKWLVPEAHSVLVVSDGRETLDRDQGTSHGKAENSSCGDLSRAVRDYRRWPCCFAKSGSFAVRCGERAHAPGPTGGHGHSWSAERSRAARSGSRSRDDRCPADTCDLGYWFDRENLLLPWRLLPILLPGYVFSTSLLSLWPLPLLLTDCEIGSVANAVAGWIWVCLWGSYLTLPVSSNAAQYFGAGYTFRVSICARRSASRLSMLDRSR